MNEGRDVTQRVTHIKMQSEKQKIEEKTKKQTARTRRPLPDRHWCERPALLPRLSRCRWCSRWCSWTWTWTLPWRWPSRWRWCRLLPPPSSFPSGSGDRAGCGSSRRRWTAGPCGSACSWSSKWWGWRRPRCRTAGGWRRWALRWGLWRPTSGQRPSRCWPSTAASSRWRRAPRSPSACGWLASWPAAWPRRCCCAGAPSWPGRRRTRQRAWGAPQPRRVF